MQLLLDKLEGMRQQFSAFSDVILYEIRVERLRERHNLAEPPPTKR
jgi:hypothetical protein